MKGSLHPPLAVAVFAGLLVACSNPDADNLLIVSFDTTRADRLSAYGYPHPTTPNIEALAARGALFENAFTHVPITAPAHASLFTGDLPPATACAATGSSRSRRKRTRWRRSSSVRASPPVR